MIRDILIQRRNFLLLCTIALLFGGATNFIDFVRLDFAALDWKLTQYHASYVEYGFIKRGVVGTFFLAGFDAFNLTTQQQFICIVLFDIAVYAALAVLLYRTLKHSWHAIPVLPIMTAILLISPVGLPQWFHDPGRFDHLNSLFLLFAATAVSRDRLYLASALCLIATANHEAFLVYGVPTILAVHLIQQETMTGRAWATIPVLLTPSVVLGMAVILFGNIENPAALHHLSQNGSGGEVWHRELLEPALGLPGYQYALCALYFTAIAYFALRHAGENRNVWIMLGVIAAHGALFFLGVDYFRWTHLLFMSLLVITALRRPSAQDSVPKSTYAVAVLLCLPLGPIGIDFGLPYVHIALRIIGG